MIISLLSNKLFLYLTVATLIVTLLTVLSLYQKKLSKVRHIFSIEQNKSFECGFDQFNKKFLGFCVQYIKTAFLFLLVDLEIALLIPLFINTSLYEKCYLLRFKMIFLVIITLLLILIIEVMRGRLR